MIKKLHFVVECSPSPGRRHGQTRAFTGYLKGVYIQRWKLRKSTKSKWKQDKESNWWIRLEKIWKDKTAAAAAAKSLQSCLTLCDPLDGSPPGSPVPGILQARTLEWVAISFSSTWKWKVKVKSLSRVRPSATPWTAAFQAPPIHGIFQARVLEKWTLINIHTLIILLEETKLLTVVADNSLFTRKLKYYFFLKMKNFKANLLLKSLISGSLFESCLLW